MTGGAAQHNNRLSPLRWLVGRGIDLVAWMLATWHIARYRLLARLGMATFQHASEAVSRSTMFIGYRIRQRFYSQLLERCGERLEMNYGATIAERETHLGSDIWIGPYCYLDLCTIDDQVLIAPHVSILAGGRHHRMERTDIAIRQQGNFPLERVHIGYGAWLGTGAVVMANVGEGAVIGAGAVVTKPIPDFAIAVGNPAKVIRMRTAPSAEPEQLPAASLELSSEDSSFRTGLIAKR